MALTDVQIRKAKRPEKTQRLFDEKGLYLELSPAGGKWWRFKYRFGDKEKRLALGTYPEVPLALARERRDDARKLVAQAIDPGEKRKIDKLVGRERSANSFEFIAGEWIKTHLANRAESHTSKVVGRLKRDAYPWIGTRPIADIKPREILAFLQTVEIRSPDTAHRLKQNISQVFRYAIATQRAERDPTADLRGALAPVVGGHFAAITDPKQVGKLMRAIEGYTGFLVVRSALRLLPLIFVRPGELRRAEWSEIDLKAAEWNIPGERMKMKQAHLVPLSIQAVAILTELKPLTEKSKYVFPSARGRSRPMSEGAIPVALKALGYNGNSMTGHGFRAMARTMLDELLGFRPEIIEHQLAHSVRDPLGRAYNRTSFLDERRQMMQKWADYLDVLRATDE
jgi:integrase